MKIDSINIKSQVLILFIFCCTTISYSQTSKSQERSREERFIFIDKKFDASFLKSIGPFQCVSKDGDDLGDMLRAIRVQAVNAGANCFKLRDFQINDTTKQLILTLDTYLASDRQLELNSEMHETNVVYIISDDKFSDKDYSFKLNGVAMNIKSGYYHKHYLKKGTETIINKGGFTGTSFRLKCEENKPPLFLTVSGIAFAEPTGIPARGPGVAVTTGKINQLSKNFGLLLVNTLVEMK